MCFSSYFISKEIYTLSIDFVGPVQCNTSMVFIICLARGLAQHVVPMLKVIINVARLDFINGQLKVLQPRKNDELFRYQIQIM